MYVLVGNGQDYKISLLNFSIFLATSKNAIRFAYTHTDWSADADARYKIHETIVECKAINLAVFLAVVAHLWTSSDYISARVCVCVCVPNTWIRISESLRLLGHFRCCKFLTNSKSQWAAISSSSLHLT